MDQNFHVKIIRKKILELNIRLMKNLKIVFSNTILKFN